MDILETPEIGTCLFDELLDGWHDEPLPPIQWRHHLECFVTESSRLKSHRITERLRLQPLAEFFNVFGYPSLV